MKLTLSEPITVLNKPVTEIEMRQPNGGDMRKCGMPFRLSDKPDGSTSTDFDCESVARYIAELGGIPPSSVNQLCVRDFQDALEVVISFFGRGKASTSTSETGSAGSGNSPISTVEGSASSI